MKTKLLLFALLLIGVSAGAQVPKATVSNDCSQNGQVIDLRPSTPSPDMGNAPAGVEMVDLGLSVKWANMNVGATAPEEYGDYFAWGETTTKSNYGWGTYKYCNGSYTTLTKYCIHSNYGSNGFTDGKTVLDPEDDAAHVNWGAEWRMPTDAEWMELRTKCTWTHTQVNGREGYVVTASNGNSIFLPTAGNLYDSDLHGVGDGYYWSASLLLDKSCIAHGFRLHPGSVGRLDYSRCCGQSVRPVCTSTAGVEMVDLGLSVKWANMNVGATAPEEYGYYFAWGETQGYTGDTNDGRSFYWSTYKYCNGSENTLTKYCSESSNGNNGFTDGKTTLDPEDDAAHVNWGAEWRMPTDAEWTELRMNCTWTWTQVNGKFGYRVSATNGNSIFLPAAGYRNETYLDHAGSLGLYWSASLNSGDSNRAYSVYFNSGTVGRNYYSRFYGLSVRPVRPSTTPAPTTHTITFVNYDGTTLQSTDVAEGTTPSYAGATPTKPEDAEYTYTFSGWSPSIVAVTAAVTYTAQFMATAKPTTPAGVEMVDLGLSVKWANMNVGATAPEEYGYYFAWGDTQGYTGDTNDGRSFDWSTYKWCNGSYTTMTKYCTESSNGNNGFTDGKTTLDPEDDAAHVNWGAEWRMPTDAEWTELRMNCTWTWTQVNGKFGYRVSATNGNSIFLPAAGDRDDSNLNFAGSLGFYWSASLASGYSNDAYSVSFSSDNVNRGINYRYRGHSVRPVRPSTTPAPTTHTITFVNYDGTTLQSTDVAEGTTPSYTGATPTKPEDAEYTYTFSGWSPSIVAATAAVTYTAQFTATAKPTTPDMGNAPAGVEMVDLGLSVKWANMNVGATAPEEYGYYFAWGETTTKGSYIWRTYFDTNDGGNTFVKYNISGGKTTLAPEDDAAHANWGAEWRMPTDDEWAELRTNCTWTWMQVNGKNGYRVSASNGNSIFLPAAGYLADWGFNSVGSNGSYWSASLRYSSIAYHVSLTSDDVQRSYAFRYVGKSVRPVRP